MELTQFDLTELCDKAVEAATEAGKLIASYANEEITVHKKEAGYSLASQAVTEVDRKSQDLIIETLKPTLQEYDLGLLTEESVDDGTRFKKDYFWCIDPLDGTLPFTEKRKGYAVSIALVTKTGEAVIGVVYDPQTEMRCWAVKNGGVFKTEKIASEIKDPTVFSIVCDDSFKQHAQYESCIESVKEEVKKSGYSKLNIIDGGGSVMNAIWVIQNQPACYFKLPKKEEGGGCLWDYAATACIFNEMGMHVSDMHGKAFNLNAEESTFFNELGVLYASEEKMVSTILALNSVR